MIQSARKIANMKDFIFFALKGLIVIAILYGVYMIIDKIPGVNDVKEVVDGIVPFQTLDDQVTISIQKVIIPRTIKITNGAKYKIRVQVFNAGDAAFETPLAIPRDSFHLEPGENRSYSYSDYRYKVYQAAFLDVYKGSSQAITGNVTIEENGDGVNITGPARKPVIFINKTTENLKVGVYDRTDQTYALPLIGTGFINLSPEQSYKWTKAPGVFNVRVFRPQAVDKILGTQSGVPSQSTITITKTPRQ